MHKDRTSLIFQYLHLKKKVCNNLNRIAKPQTLSHNCVLLPVSPFNHHQHCIPPPLLEQSYTGNKTERLLLDVFYSNLFEFVSWGGTSLSYNTLPKNRVLEITATGFRGAAKCELRADPEKNNARLHTMNTRRGFCKKLFTPVTNTQQMYYDV